MEKKKTYWNILTYIIYAIVIIFAFLAISAKYSLFGVKLLVVKSGSMEPALKTGSLVVDKAESSYQKDNIVTFKDPNNPLETITHRIVDIETKDDISLYTTQGDANGTPDSTKILSDKILGKVVFDIPILGYIVAFTRTVPGVIILIIIPAVIIIYDEINKIKAEIKKKRSNS